MEFCWGEMGYAQKVGLVIVITEIENIFIIICAKIVQGYLGEGY